VVMARFAPRSVNRLPSAGAGLGRARGQGRGDAGWNRDVARGLEAARSSGTALLLGLPIAGTLPGGSAGAGLCRDVAVRAPQAGRTPPSSLPPPRLCPSRFLPCCPFLLPPGAERPCLTAHVGAVCDRLVLSPHRSAGGGDAAAPASAPEPVLAGTDLELLLGPGSAAPGLWLPFERVRWRCVRWTCIGGGGLAQPVGTQKTSSPKRERKKPDPSAFETETC